MSDEREWTRPKKPYTVTPDRSQQPQKPYKKPFSKAKPVVLPAKNNANNKLLHEAVRHSYVVKIYINNLLCSDAALPPTYIGKIRTFDDFTISISANDTLFLINKSAIASMEIQEDFPDIEIAMKNED